MLEEFKQFAMRGNVVDMAVGIVIGTAFGAIARSLVDDVIMPPLGLIMGNADFTDMFLVLQQGQPPAPYDTLVAAQEAGAVTINYGLFINTILTFLIVAFAMFILIRNINRLQREEEVAEAEPTTKECPYCLSTIPLEASRCPQCTSHLEPA